MAIGIRSLNDKSNVDFATVKRTIVHRKPHAVGGMEAVWRPAPSLGDPALPMCPHRWTSPHLTQPLSRAARYQPGPGSRFVGRGFDIALLELDPATVSGKNELVALPTYVRKWHRGLALKQERQGRCGGALVSQLALPSVCARTATPTIVSPLPALPAILAPNLLLCSQAAEPCGRRHPPGTDWFGRAGQWHRPHHTAAHRPGAGAPGDVQCSLRQLARP